MCKKCCNFAKLISQFFSCLYFGRIPHRNPRQSTCNVPTTILPTALLLWTSTKRSFHLRQKLSLAIAVLKNTHIINMKYCIVSTYFSILRNYHFSVRSPSKQILMFELKIQNLTFLLLSIRFLKVHKDFLAGKILREINFCHFWLLTFYAYEVWIQAWSWINCTNSPIQCC